MDIRFLTKRTLLVLCCLWNISAIAATFVVDSLGDEPDWTSTDNLCKTTLNTCTLRAAIEQANTLAGPDIINFSVTSTINIGAAGQYNINDHLDITNVSGSLTINGGNATRIFEVNPSSTLSGIVFNVRGLILANGFTSGDGGAIAAHDAILTVINCTFLNNAADSNGGAIYTIYIGSGNTTIADSTFSNNSADLDGGAFYKNGGNANITNSTFSLNIAGGNGGAFYKYYGNATLSNTVFSSNSTSTGDGGAIYNISNSGILSIDRSTVLSNFSNQGGGGIKNSSGTVVITNSTFFDNRTASGYSGGGIFNGAATPVGTLKMTNSTVSKNTSSFGGGLVNDGILELTNVTFFGNTADSAGGGLANYGTINFMRNTLIANSPSGQDCYNDVTATFSENTQNFIKDGSCGAILSGDPLLGNLANHGGPTQIHALLSGSPAIDAGNSTYCPPADQRGLKRTDGNNDGTVVCDIGAFEYQPLPLPPPPVPLAGYGSIPIPNSTLFVGKGIVGTPVGPVELIIQEIGEAPLTVNFNGLTGSHASDFKKTETSNPLNFTIPDGGSDHVVKIECTPSAVGLRTATLNLTSNDENHLAIAYPLECIGESPGYLSTPLPNTPFNVGQTFPGGTISQNFTIEENGTGDLVVETWNIEGLHKEDFTVTPPIFPFTIKDNSGRIETLTVLCIPAEIGLRTATLILTTNDPKNPHPTYPLECTGVDVLARYSSAPPQATLIDFGKGLLGTVITKPLVVENKGNLPLTVGFEAFQGQAAIPFFSIVDPPLFVDTPDGVEIPGGSAQTLILQCIPSAEGRHTATLVLTSTDSHFPTPSYPLSCTGQVTRIAGYHSTLEMNAPLDFGPVLINTSVVRSFEISEVGTDDLKVDLAIEGPDAAQFQLLSPALILIPDNRLLTELVNVQCTPLEAKLYSAILTVVTNDPDYPQINHPLTCQGISDNISDSIIGPRFDSLPLPNSTLEIVTLIDDLGQPTTTTLTLLSIGDDTLEILNLTIEGVDRDHFSIQPESAHFPILINESGDYPLTLQCRPKEFGEYIAQLVLATNDPHWPVVTYPLVCHSLFSEPSSGNIELSNNQIDQYTPADTFIGRLTTIDNDESDYHHYTLLDDADGQLIIFGDGLYTAKALDEVTTPTLKILVKSTNLVGHSFTEAFTLYINEVKPEISAQIRTQMGSVGSYLIIDNPERFRLLGFINPPVQHLEQPATLKVMIYWTPPDGQPPMAIPITRRTTLKPNMETSFFSGRLLGASGFFEMDFGYRLDDGHFFQVPQVASLMVYPDQPPTDISLSANKVSEDSPPGTVIGQLSTADRDKDEALIYSVIEDSGGHFMTVGNELQISYSSFPLRFDKRRVHPIVIRSIDIAGNYFDKPFTVIVHKGR